MPNIVPSHATFGSSAPMAAPTIQVHGSAVSAVALCFAFTLVACGGVRYVEPYPMDLVPPSMASARASRQGTGVATEAPIATEALATDTAPIDLPSWASVPILDFQDQGAACEDLTANGAEWAFIATTAPRAGQRVASGFHARGCANVFEAALSWRLADGQDTTIAEGFGMASCGTGCVGTFDLIVDYPARDEAEIGYLEVFASSADDGRPIHVNRIPVVLE